jgi:hypothetical protein
MDSLILHVLAWPTLGVALLVFGFAPGAVLRLIILLYQRENPRRRELLGELYSVPRIERPFWVAEQLETALFEGLHDRMTSWRARRAPEDAEMASRQLYSNRRSPAWTWGEVVLACDLVFRKGWRPIAADSPQVIRLSEQLQRMNIHPVESRSPQFRNPNAVARMGVDIATAHPDYLGRRTNGSHLAREVLSAFLANPREMHALAESIGGRTGRRINWARRRRRRLDGSTKDYSAA